MMAIHAVSAATLFTAFLLCDTCLGYPSLREREEARPVCVGCGDTCDKCKYGFGISALCGIAECRRGPGQSCGGPSEVWGVCGEGLSCNCNKCSGCSLDTLECFPTTCIPPHHNWKSGRLDVYGLFPIAS